MTPLSWAIVATAVMLVIAAVVGLAKGKGVFGVLIDGRGKYSLSRLQILLWTALIIGGYFGIALPKLAFVTIPNDVLGLLGVTLGSTVISTAIKANKISDGQTRDEEQNIRKAIESAQDELLRLAGVEAPETLSLDEKSKLLAELGKDYLEELNREAEAKRKPSWMDLFSQEQKDKEHLIDIGKLQMFAWTIAALVIYGSILVSKLTLPLAQVSELTELPNVTSTILALMGISQAAYLGMKLPSPKPSS
ncbi:MAG: hypothetical protein ACE5OS_00890 [Anaerolineae bacterium]